MGLYHLLQLHKLLQFLHQQAYVLRAVPPGHHHGVRGFDDNDTLEPQRGERVEVHLSEMDAGDEVRVSGGAA